jgi:hypothetical protein
MPIVEVRRSTSWARAVVTADRVLAATDVSVKAIDLILVAVGLA